MFYETSQDKLIFKGVPSDIVSKLVKHANYLFIHYDINGSVFERLVTNLEIRGNAQGKLDVSVSSMPCTMGNRAYTELYTDKTLIETPWGSFYIDVNFIGKRGVDE